MKIVTLSDHTGDMIEEAESARRFEYERRQADYDAEYERIMEIRDREREVYRAAGEKRSAWSNATTARIADGWRKKRRIRAILRAIWLVMGFTTLTLWDILLLCRLMFLDDRRRKAVMPPPTGSENAWRVGHEGEQRVVNHLAGRFGDDWTLIGGYMSAKGEIDQTLVGPMGIMAMEIKNLSGTIRINGLDWWRSRGKNQPYHPITDGGDRSPARQLDETASGLERALSARMGDFPEVIRAVVLANDLCRVQADGNIAGVHLVTKTRNLDADLFRRSRPSLSPKDVDAIVELIRGDHASNERRRGHRGPRFGGIVSDREII